MARRKRTKDTDFKFVLEIDPSPIELATAYRNVADGLSDMRPVFKGLAPRLGAELQVNLDSKGSSLGESFPDPHNSRYSHRKKMEGYGSKPMVRTGELRKSLPGIIRMGRSVMSIGLRGKVAKRGSQLQFKRGYVFMGWSSTMTRITVDAINKFVNDLIEDSINRFEAAS